MAKTQFLDEEGLTLYDEKIKQYIESQNTEEVISNTEPEQTKGDFWLQEY